MSNLKTWNQRPSRVEVQNLIKEFFQKLQSGELKDAEALVTHAYPDWGESIFTIWQDHYLIHATPKNSSFEGKEWQTQLSWLKDLSIKESFEWIKEDRVWVDFLFNGKPSGYIGEFTVKENAGVFNVERESFRMA